MSKVDLSRTFEVKDVFTEHPDVDVIMLKDGTFIGINSESIVHYHGELFADDCESILRPDTREYLSVYEDGTQKKRKTEEVRTHFVNTRLIRDIELLDVGESLNWTDGIGQNLSVVRTR